MPSKWRSFLHTGSFRHLILVGLLVTGFTTLLATTVPPVVTIIDPQPLAKVAGYSRVEAIATDDVGIVEGQVFIDGQPIALQYEAIPLYSSKVKGAKVDLPNLKTSPYQKGASITGFQYNYYGYWYTTLYADGPHAVSVIVKNMGNLTAQDQLYVFANNTLHNEPAISLVAKKTGPFRLVLTGRNFQKGANVFINRSIAPGCTYKSGTKVIVSGGAKLKALLPKGIPVPIVVSNPDGGTSERYNFILP